MTFTFTTINEAVKEGETAKDGEAANKDVCRLIHAVGSFFT